MSKDDSGFLKEQHFEDDCKGGIAVINKLDDTDLLKENYMMKSDGGNGMSKGGNMRKVCQIPAFLFDHDPALIEYNKNLCQYPNYARRILRNWLAEHPEYLCSNGGI